MQKIQSIQLLRALAVASVMVFHAIVLFEEYASRFSIKGVFPSTFPVLSAGFDVFFVVSGMIMALTTYATFDQPGTALHFLKQRISRIYPP